MRDYLTVALVLCAVLACGRTASAADGVRGAGFTLRAQSRPSLVPVWRSAAVALGERSIDITVADTGTEVTFIRVHQNEMPAGAVGARINREVPSRFIDLSHRHGRYVRLTLSGADYSIDPNRIFSSDVPPMAFGVTLPSAASEEAQRLGHVITGLLLPRAPVVALHNNRGALLESYSADPRKMCARGMYVNPRMTSSTFVVVPTQALFDAVRAPRINVVWEHRAGALDDGSLLAYARRRNIPYVNVEAGLGSSADAQLAVVRQMVALLRATQAAPVARPRPATAARASD